MSELYTLVLSIITHTPIWVWIVLLIIIKKGITLLKDTEVSVGKSCLMPGIFILWSVDTIATKFSYPLYLVPCYLIFLTFGAFAGLYIYRNKTFYVEHTVLMQTGSQIPLCIMIINFCIKYALNVLLSVQPALYSQVSFNISYGIIAGFTVGLFFGNTIRAIRAQSRLVA